MIPILKQGRTLITSLQHELTDTEWEGLRDTLLERVGEDGCDGVVVDITGMPVLDSFAGRTLADISRMLRLRGARTVICGIQPEVAFTMARLGLTLGGADTALDFEEGLARLDHGLP